MLVIIFVYFSKTSHMERGTWGTTNISTEKSCCFHLNYTHIMCVGVYVYVSSRRIYIIKYLHLYVDCLNETRSFNVKFGLKVVCLTLLSKISSNVVVSQLQRYGIILLFLDRFNLD